MPEALQEGGVHILRAVRAEVHEGHQCNDKQEQLPVGGDGAAELAPLRMAGAFPNLRFADTQTHKNGEKRRKTAQQKQGPPAPGVEEKAERERGEQIPERITLLQE